MKNIKILAIIVLAGAFCVSCNKFLSKTPENAIPEYEALTSVEDCADFVVGIYSGFKNPSLYSGALALLPDIQADLVYTLNGSTNVYGDVYRWNINPTNADTEGVYAALYQIVSRCNFFLDYKESVQATIKTKAEQVEFDKRLGDVYFAKALAYSELIKIYCEAYDPANADNQLGISLVDTYKGETAVPRSSLKDSYKKILEDLDKAYDLTPRIGANTTFFTKGSISALKARVCLYMQDWEGAIKASTNVIDTLNVNTLADATYYQFQDDSGKSLTAYDVLFKYDDGDEIIWKIAMSTTDRGGALGKIFLGFVPPSYYPNYVPANWVLDLFTEDQNDGRIKTLFNQVKTGYAHGLETPIVTKYPGNPDIDGGSTPLFTNMPKVFRLAEQYLIRAEAYAQMGETSKANKDLTTLRRKRIKGYGQSSNSGDALIKDIRNERVKELYMEGFRLADLKRYKQGFERKPQAQTISGPDKLKIVADNPLFTWPIPQHEIDASQGIVQPNQSNKRN